MKRIALSIIPLIMSSGVTAQIEVTGRWEDTCLKPEIQGRHVDVSLNAATVGVEAGLIPETVSVFGATGTGSTEMDGYGIDGNLDSFWRAGFQATVWRHGRWSTRIAADVQQWHAEDSFLLADHPFDSRMILTECRVRPTVTWQTDHLALYAGPSIVSLDGSVVVGWQTQRIRTPVDANAQVGGFAGFRWKFTPHLILTGEGEITEVSRAATVGVGYRF